MDIGEFFGSLYTGFGLEDLYGSGEGELAEYLWGNASSVVATNQFVGIGLITIGIALAVVAIYYYVLGQLLQKPSWGNRFTWLMALVANSLIAFLAAWQWTLSDLYSGDMVTIDAKTGQQTDLPISALNCLQFGLANAIVTVLLFIVFSLILKWKSRDFSHIPF